MGTDNYYSVKEDVQKYIDGCKTNNSLDNLEWCSYSDNLVHAYTNGLRSSGEKRNGNKT